MEGQERDGEGWGEKGFFTDKPPVDGPLEHEAPAELKRAGEIPQRVRPQKWQSQKDLSKLYQLVTSVGRCGLVCIPECPT